MNGQPPLVPENLLKRKNDLDRLSRERDAQHKAMGNRKVYSKTKGLKVRKAEKFLVTRRSEVNAKKRYERVSKKGLQSKAPKEGAKTVRLLDVTGAVVAEGEAAVSSTKAALARKAGAASAAAAKAAQVVTEVLPSNSLGASSVFVVRIRPDHNLPSAVLRALSSLRLRAENDGVFVRYNAASSKILDLVRPYVVYGTITAKVCEELITRRGFGKVDGKRVPLSDNTVIEKALGDETGIICLTDLVAEIMSPSDDFNKASNFLWPFRLSDKEGGFGKNTLKVTKGKEEAGDKGARMNEVVRSIL